MMRKLTVEEINKKLAAVKTKLDQKQGEKTAIEKRLKDHGYETQAAAEVKLEELETELAELKKRRDVVMKNAEKVLAKIDELEID